MWPRKKFLSSEEEHLTALLGALSLVLSGVEYIIPKPVPFARLGIANLPLLIALDILRPRAFAALALVKVLSQALLSGTLLSYVFLFSLFGTLSSACAMYICRRLLKTNVSFVGVSVTGALLSSSTQLFLARFFVLGATTVYLAPPFLALSLVTGFALGLFCEHFTRQSEWYARVLKARVFQNSDKEGRGGSGHSQAETKTGTRFPILPFLLFLLASPPLLFAPWQIRLALFATLWLAALITGRERRPLLTVIVFATIVFANTLVPYGKALFSLGPWTLTLGALESGLRKAAAVQGLLLLSRLTLDKTRLLPDTLVGETLRLAAEISARKHRIQRGRLIKGIDELLLSL